MLYKATIHHVHQCFHAVGHGTFLTGTLISHDRSIFRWVYDCGSKRSSAINNALSRADSWHLWKDGSIDLLVLSHFDDDHINGLESLLRKHKVRCLVLPYSEWQQRVHNVLETRSGVVSASTAQFQLSPTTWLQSLGLADNVGTILLVKGGSTPRDGEVDPTPFPTEYSYEEPPARDENARVEEADQRELRMTERLFGPGPKVKTVSHGSVFAAHSIPIEFKFFNAELSGTTLGTIITGPDGNLVSKTSKRGLKHVRADIEEVIKLLRLHEPFDTWPADWRAKLQMCYSHHFGSRSAARNNISLCMYSAPRHGSSGLQKCNIFSDHGATGTIKEVDACQQNEDLLPGVLCTGDLKINHAVIDEMRSHFGYSRWNTIGLTQIPHHGSKHSWASGSAAEFSRSEFVHCAPGSSRHPHEDVILDLSKFTVYTADYANSVNLKYHFYYP
jgi:hypothetical protein